MFKRYCLVAERSHVERRCQEVGLSFEIEDGSEFSTFSFGYSYGQLMMAELGLRESVDDIDPARRLLQKATFELERQLGDVVMAEDGERIQALLLEIYEQLAWVHRDRRAGD